MLTNYVCYFINILIINKYINYVKKQNEQNESTMCRKYVFYIIVFLCKIIRFEQKSSPYATSLIEKLIAVY